MVGSGFTKKASPPANPAPDVLYHYTSAPLTHNTYTLTLALQVVIPPIFKTNKSFALFNISVCGTLNCSG